jgi:2-keto-4-pentenoate hydratase/2-oxohepta-3-ene-1,7-dioic acid hydratase in catechol pathway
VIFSKFSNSLAANEEDIPLPANSKQVDYEGELGIVIGKEAYMVPENEALGHVFGYFVGNDVSARDLQKKTSQWLLGKSCEKFFPNGPYVVTADEVPDPQNLSIKTTVNGEVRQNSNTSNMIFSCKQLVSYISQYMKLEPGDVISTGTPEGVIAGFPEKKRVWLSDGDVVEVEIEKLGKIRNKFVK